MRTFPFSLAAAAALSFALAGCDSTATAPDDAALSADEAEALAVDFDGVTVAAIDGEAAQLGASFDEVGSAVSDREASFEFRGTRSCSRGGEVQIQGQVQRTFVSATRTMTLDFRAKKNPVDCAFGTRRGIVTINGNPALEVTAHRERVAGEPSGLQTHTLVGSFTWTRGDRSGVCDVRLKGTIDPEAKTRTVVGTFCGRGVEKTVSWGERSG